MTIRAVVFDIGGVLAECEPMDFGPRAEADYGLKPGALGADLADVWSAGAVGGITEAQLTAALRERSGLTADQVEVVLAEMWRQYLGVANTELIAFARALRPAYRTGVEPAEMAFLDDLPRNVEAARELGVAAVLFENTAQAIADLAALL